MIQLDINNPEHKNATIARLILQRTEIELLVIETLSKAVDPILVSSPNEKAFVQEHTIPTDRIVFAKALQLIEKGVN